MSPKLKKKILLIFILLGIYMLFIINIHKIKFAFSMLNIYNQNNPTQTTNPLDSILRAEGHMGTKQETAEGANTEIENDDLSSISKELPVSKNPIVKPSSEDPETVKPYLNILEEYNKKFKELQDTFMEDLDNLIEQGILDYKEGNISPTKLMIKYMNEGSKLEKISDSQFETMIKSLEKELKDNGHDTFIIDEIKGHYKTLKDIKKENIINRGMKYVK